MTKLNSSEVSELAAELSDGIFANTVKTGQVRVNLLQIRQALRNSGEFFIQFFLGEQLTFPVPDIHKEVWDELVAEIFFRILILIPRGHAKTTLAKLACVWYLIFSDYKFVLYVSGSHDLVVPYVNDIAAFFESENFKAVFGGIEWLKRQDGIGVYKFKILATGKVCILRGLGAGQRVRGINVDNERPQLAVCDDIEDDDDVASEILHLKKLRWFYGPFMKCMSPVKNKIVVCGNLLGSRSVMNKLLKSPRWRTFFYAVLRANGEPLWPDVWPIEKIREDFLEYQEMGLASKWFAEMMNQPVPEGGGVIRADEINYMPPRVPEEIEYGFIVIDPAISKEKWADDAAITAHGFVEEIGMWQIVEEYHQKGMDPTDIFWKAVDMAERWGFHVIGVEVDAMQKVLEHYFLHLALLHSKTHLSFVPVSSGNRKKNARIAAWASSLKTGGPQPPTYALTQGDFIITQQLLNYQPTYKDNDDNIIDSCAYGHEMIRQFLFKIMQKIQKYPTGQTCQPIVQIARI